MVLTTIEQYGWEKAIFLTLGNVDTVARKPTPEDNIF